MGSRLTTNLNVTYLRYSNVSIGDTNKAVVWNIDKVLEGKFYTFKSNIAWGDSKRNNSIDVSDKLWVPAIQNTNCGFRVNTRDKDYFSKYWDGFIFVDIDHLEDDPDLFLDTLHNKLCKYNFYLGSQTSYSKNGFHLIFYIPKQIGTADEYYRYAAYIYTILFNGLIPFENYDWHNFQHHQVLKLAPHPWKVNNNFKVECLNVDDREINSFFRSQAQHFIELYNRPEIDTNSDHKKLNKERYNYSYIDDSNVGEKFFYFEHTDRWRLMMTLMYIYNEDVNRVFEAAKIIMKYSYTDKHSYSELCNYFDPVHSSMDWYKQYHHSALEHPEALTSKIEFLEKYFNIKLSDKYNTVIQMKDNEYLLDYKDVVLNSLQPGLNFMKVPTGGGKTTFWDVIRPNCIIIEPYGSVINDKYDSEVYKAAGTGNNIDITQSYQVTNYWKFIDFVRYENKFYEYIIVDESHLIGMQSYRNMKKNGHTMIDFINALNEYHMQFPDTKIILQTATPSNEDYFFNINNRLTFNKNLLADVNISYDCIQFLNKKGDYVDDIYASIYYLTNKLHDEGRKVMIYWGNGGVNVMKAIQHIVDSLQGLKCAVYHKRNNNSFDMDYIHNNKMVGDYDVLICSCYFSVGCDLNDTDNAGIIIVGNNPFQEDAQCIGRFRISKNIDVHIIPDRISGICKTDVSEALTRLQRKIKIENEIYELRTNSIISPACNMEDADAFSYMECSHDYFSDIERKFNLYKEIGYNYKNTIKCEYDNENKRFMYDICSNVNGIDMPLITCVDDGLDIIKKEVKKYYKTNKEIQEDLYLKFCNGDRNFKKYRIELNDRPKLQDWVRAIEIFSKYYDVDYILHNFPDKVIKSVTYQNLKELLRWKIKIEKGQYDKIEKSLIDSLIYNYDLSDNVREDIEVWILLYYCVWISQSEQNIKHRYDMNSKKVFFLYNQWSRRIYNILLVNTVIRNYILNYGIKDEDIIVASIPDFLKGIYEKPMIEDKIKVYLNSDIYSNDIKKFLNIKLAKYDSKICSSVQLESNLKSLAVKLNISGIEITDKFNKKKLEKYELHVGMRFETQKILADKLNVSKKTLTQWKSKGWIRNL